MTSTRPLTCALLAALLLTPLSSTANEGIQGRISSQQARLHQTRVELEQKRNQLGSAQARAADLRRQISETNDSIAQAGVRLDQLNREVERNQTKIAWNSVQLKAAQATLERHNEALRHRLVDAYEHGETGYLNVLLSATSFSDFVERWDDIRYLILANQHAVRARRDAERRVAETQHLLEGNESALESSLEHQRQVRAQLSALAQTRQGLLVAAETERRNVAQQVQQLEEISAQEESALEALIVERQREEAARREAERRAALLAGKEIAPPSSGEFTWPVSGPITSPFGYRSDPYGNASESEYHTGIDIAAPMGSTVTAADGGTVIYAAWYGGYGNAIIVDHGNGLSSLYGHLSQIFVTDHQAVQRGQAIGAVGSTGRSTGPHLHFEIRLNGQPVDPASRLR